MPSLIRNLFEKYTSRGVQNAFRQPRDELRTQRLHKASVKKAERLSYPTNYRLNLACGPNRKEGWINIDLTDGADLQLDLRERLPFPDDSVEVIYSEHFFEHLNYPSFADSNAFAGLELSGYQSEVLFFLRESYRVLVPGGLFSVGVPAAEQTLIAYANRDEQAFEAPRRIHWHPACCDTYMHQVNYLFRQGHEHKYAYDGETLARILQRAGFVEVNRRDFDPSLDSESRRVGTLYMKARKPFPSSVRAKIPLSVSRKSCEGSGFSSLAHFYIRMLATPAPPAPTLSCLPRH
jgi:predicted SAM-dependent methyltransferase